MVRLTKAQQKDRDRIEAWKKGEPFKEITRDKNPSIPVLGVKELIEDGMYVPQFISDGGKFYTPVDMATWLYYESSYGYHPDDQILEPCVGIGNLIWPMVKDLRRNGYEDLSNIHAWDVDSEAVEIGQKLFPELTWVRDTVLDNFKAHYSRYDCIFMNPPFNSTWATMGGQENSETGATKSEHLFLEFAVQALKDEGCLVALAPYNWFDRVPKRLRAWLDERIHKPVDFGQAPGEFRFTGMRVHGWFVQRNEEHHNGSAGISTPIQLAEQLEENNSKRMNHIHSISKSLLLDPALYPNAVQVPLEAYEAFRVLDPTPALQSPKELYRHLRSLGAFEAAKWVKENPIHYGMGYWNGFTCNGSPVIDLSKLNERRS